MGDLVQRYEDAHPCDRWICDGVKAWMTGAEIDRLLTDTKEDGNEE